VQFLPPQHGIMVYMTHLFSIQEAIRFGWHGVKSHSGVLFPAMLVVAVIQMLSMFFDSDAPTALDVSASIVLGVASVFVGTGLTQIALGIAQGHHVAFRQLFPHWRIAWNYFVAGLLSGLIVMIPIAVAVGIGFLAVFFTGGSAIFGGAPAAMTGMIIAGFVAAGAVIVGGVAAALYLGIRYSMVRYAVLDHHAIVQSLRTSWAMTSMHVWKLAGFLAVLGLLNVLGFVVLVVGLLVTIPISIIAYAHVYLKLKSHHGH
jgi:hypothetical protein